MRINEEETNIMVITREGEEKGSIFNVRMKIACDNISKHNIKIVVEDCNIKIGRKEIYACDRKI